MNRTKVFAHRGIIGILSSPEAELIAHCGNGNIGCVADASKVDFSQEAIDILKTIKHNNDAIGDVDVFKADDGMTIFGWFGPHMRVVVPAECEAARGTDVSLLTATEGIEPTDDFKVFVDKMLDE